MPQPRLNDATNCQQPNGAAVGISDGLGVIPDGAVCLRPGCGRPQHNRGLCVGCYQVAGSMVRNGETTWPKLAAAGKCTKLRKQRRRGEIRAWFVSAPKTRLLPCPFCGASTAKAMETGNQCTQVVCDNCGACGPTSGNDDDATNYWNDQHDA